MIVNILMHFSLGINQHMTCKFLDARHHYLRLDPEIVLFRNYWLFVHLVLLKHVQVLLFYSVEKSFCVIVDREDCIFFKIRVCVDVCATDVAILCRLSSGKTLCSILTMLCSFFWFFFALFTHSLFRGSLIILTRQAVSNTFFHGLEVTVMTIKILSVLSHYNYNWNS